MWKKISAYFSAGGLTGGLLAALAGSAFLYLARFGLSSPWIETPSALLFFGLMISGDRRRWFWSGLFLGLFWFWWIGVSFLHYGHPWAIPFVSLAVALVYALLFWLMALSAEWIGKKISTLSTIDYQLSTSTAKALWLWLWSLLHPFGFDWYKPELTLLHTPFGVDGVSFGLVLTAILCLLALKAKRIPRSIRITGLIVAALLLIPALDLRQARVLRSDPSGRIVLAGTHIPVEIKWRQDQQQRQVQMVLERIDEAIAAHRQAIFLPESVLPIFLNRSPGVLNALRHRSRRIDIVLGALYFTPEGEHRNSAYHFRDGNYTVADKTVLVPFGEANPLPAWASRWVNRIFFDGAPDYRPARHPTDFLIDGKRYRAAVCFEGTSERLYADRPARMDLLSNNGWFVPSVEPTLQRLLLEYYHRKYGTEIWHAVNMAGSYVITDGKRETENRVTE